MSRDENEQLGVKALLVRPDGVTIWATDETVSLGEIALIAARWFGEPSSR
jgi:hypothetical protein